MCLSTVFSRLFIGWSLSSLSWKVLSVFYCSRFCAHLLLPWPKGLTQVNLVKIQQCTRSFLSVSSPLVLVESHVCPPHCPLLLSIVYSLPVMHLSAWAGAWHILAPVFPATLHITFSLSWQVVKDSRTLTRSQTSEGWGRVYFNFVLFWAISSHAQGLLLVTVLRDHS